MCLYSHVQRKDNNTFIRDISLLVSHTRAQGAIRWPTTVTSKPNAHSKLQIAHIKFKSLTANSNYSQQIQIAHSKFKSLTANYKSRTANYKSLTANSNRPQQIQIVHGKLKSLTANSNYKLLTSLGVFGYLLPAVQLV